MKIYLSPSWRARTARCNVRVPLSDAGKAAGRALLGEAAIKKKSIDAVWSK